MSVNIMLELQDVSNREQNYRAMSPSNSELYNIP